MQGCLQTKRALSFMTGKLFRLLLKRAEFTRSILSQWKKSRQTAYFILYSSRGAYVKLDDVLTDDKIYKVQADIIRDMAAQGNCVFVGRCSDYILRNNEKCFNIFLRGNLDDRVKRVMSEQNISEAEAKKIVSRADKKRRSYYNYYTNREWGNINNYDIALNLSTISETDAVDVIINYLEKV